MASRWGHGSLRLLEQAVCELGLAEQGRQGEKSVCLEPSPVLWDLANHEARKGGGTRHGRWHATGPGYPAGSRDWPWPLPRHSPGGMARRGDASGRPLKQSGQHVARRWVQTLMPSQGTSMQPAVPRHRVRKTLDA